MPLQVVIFGVELNPRYPDAEPVPHTVLVNPVLTPVGGEMEEGWEGCLSVPGMRGLVPRYRQLRYQGYDQHGQPHRPHRERTSTRASCSTNATTWLASSTRCASATCAISASPRSCFPGEDVRR